MRDQALAYASEHQQLHIEQLMELLCIPSVSTLPEHKPAVRRAAEWVRNYLQNIGMSRVELIETTGHPAVYAEWLGADPSAPTVLIYGHYDVQPTDPDNEWRTSPFSPTVIGDDLYARGAADDKGPFFALLAAVACYLQSAGRIPVNIKVLAEGEEEVTSTNLPLIVAERATQLACDTILIADHPMATPEVGILMYGVRGNLYTELEVRTLPHDLHSGTFGGVAPNAFNVICQIIATLTDQHGKIAVPGFYDRVRELSTDERALINGGLANEAVVLALTGASALIGEAEYSVAERMSVRPTLDVHGIRGGFIGAGSKTVIPAVAVAKISMRTVPDQDSHDLFALLDAHIQSVTPPSAHAMLRALDSSQPTIINYQHLAVQLAEEAYRLTFGATPLYMRGGGSLPILAEFQQQLRQNGHPVPIVMIGLGLPDDNIHAPNEKLHLPIFYRGITMIIRYFALLGTELAASERLHPDGAP
ncbi:dipeptidase [Candidatus Gracilibacteria bacterium]|nr:dipeptidase [Candidatus Gracilibacteria bacterium]